MKHAGNANLIRNSDIMIQHCFYRYRRENFYTLNAMVLLPYILLIWVLLKQERSMRRRFYINKKFRLQSNE